MKKRVLLSIVILIGVLTLTGCGKEKRTINYLLNGYVEAYTKADLKAVKDIFAPYYLEYNKKNATQEELDDELKSAKEMYGDDFSISYQIDKEEEFTEEELEKYNKKVKETYKSDDKATKCYKYEGTITLKGSKKTDELKLATIGRCQFDGEWYLVRR